jgi:hypothetical protein
MAPIQRQLGILDDNEFFSYEEGVSALLDGRRLKPIRVAMLLPEQAAAIGATSLEVLLSSYTAMNHDLASELPT